MFPAYPRFEELPLRIEVEWNGRKRPVVARLVSLPNSWGAFVLCQFADGGNEGEWLVCEGKKLYSPGAPHKLLFRYLAHDISTRQRINKRAWSERGAEKIRSHVKRAFAFEDFSVARVFVLSQLPAAPRIILDESGITHWWKNEELIPFSLKNELSLDANQAQQQLIEAWQDGKSDAHFAWQWAQMSEAQQLFLLTGSSGGWDELEGLMKLVLTSSVTLWQADFGWTWELGGETGEIWNQSYTTETTDELLGQWGTVLREHYFPALNPSLRLQYPCVKELWAKQVAHVVWVDVGNSPSAHEQLEAKLALRAWLRDKVTPQQTEELLAI